MKIFKKIYYPALIALTLIFAFFSLFTASEGASGIKLTDAKTKSVEKYIDGIVACEDDYGIGEYVRTQLRNDAGVGVSVISSRPDKTETLPDGTPNPDFGMNTSATYHIKDGKISPTVVRQYAEILPATSSEIAGDSATTFVGYEVINYVIAVPGSVSIAKAEDPENEALSYGDAVAVIVNYDRSTLSETGNAAAIASVMSAISTLTASEEKPANDFVFVFAAGGENGNIGAYAFKNQFKGFNRVAERVKAVVSFSAAGADRALVLSAGSGDAAKAFVKTAEDGYASSVMNLFAGGDGVVEAYDGVSAYSVSGFNNNKAGTVYETKENLDDEFVAAMAVTAENTLSYFADINLGEIEVSKIGYGYYDYLGATVVYSAAWSYAFGGLALLMLSAVICLAIFKKDALDLKSLGLGAAVQALTLVFTLAVTCALTMLVMLALGGFGVIDFHALGRVTFGNAGLVAIMAAVMAVISVPFYTLLRKILKVRLPYIAYGSVALLAVSAAAACFAAPSVALPAAIAAVTMLAVLIATMLLKDKVKQLLGCNMSELLLFAIPAIFLLPVALSDAFAASTVAPVILLPLILSTIIGYGGTALPFVGYALDKAVDCVCVKKAADGTAEKKQCPLRGLGAPIVAVIGVVGAVLLATVGTLGFGRGASTSYGYNDEIYKDAIVYCVENGVTTAEIHDLDLYSYIAKYEDGFVWSEKTGAYILSSAPALSIGQVLTVNADNANSKRFIVYTSEKSVTDYTVKLSGFGAGNITKVTFEEANNGDINSYEVDAAADELTFIVPADYEGGFAFEIEGDLISVNIDVEQRCATAPGYANNALWALVHHEYSDDAFISSTMRMTLIMRSALTFTI